MPSKALEADRSDFEEHMDLVQKVQAFLWVAAYYKGQFDGIDGPGTRDAITRYQKAYHLEATGRIDETLIKHMGIDESGIFKRPPSTYLKKLPGNAALFAKIVQKAQVVLFVYGYYDGLIDGQVGNRTRAAITRYQSEHGLSETGTLTTDLLDSLRIPAR